MLGAAGILAAASGKLRASQGGRALVCIYLSGGNDSNNLVVPIPQYDSYAQARGLLAIPRDSLLRAVSSSDQTEFGFHPAAGELHRLFTERALAVVANVGQLRAPLQRAQGSRVAPPAGMHGRPDPDLDYFRPGYSIPAWAARAMGLTPQSHKSLITGFASLEPGSEKDSSLAVLAMGGVASESVRKSAIEAAKNPPAFHTMFPPSGIGQQLRQVAALLRAGPSLGLERAVFFASMGGFATKSFQAERQPRLFAELGSAMSAFHAATLEMGISQSVTSYTDTEHNRTLLPNLTRGTDPAWGGHHLVMGGSVLGGQVHGQFPELRAGGPDDASGTGVWMPAHSKHQFAATLANWYGISYGELPNHFPDIQNFASHSLNFLAG